MTIYSLDVLLFLFRTVCCSMSSSNCCFLTCIQISQEAGQVVWYSHLFKNLPSVLWSTQVKSFSVVSEADVFSGILSFSMIQWILAIWSLVPLLFLNPACTSGSSWFMYCWSMAWGILSITSLACEMSTSVCGLSILGLPWWLTGWRLCLQCRRP